MHHLALFLLDSTATLGEHLLAAKTEGGDKFKAKLIEQVLSLQILQNSAEL